MIVTLDHSTGGVERLHYNSGERDGLSGRYYSSAPCSRTGARRNHSVDRAGLQSAIETDGVGSQTYLLPITMNPPSPVVGYRNNRVRGEIRRH